MRLLLIAVAPVITLAAAGCQSSEEAYQACVDSVTALQPSSTGEARADLTSLPPQALDEALRERDRVSMRVAVEQSRKQELVYARCGSRPSSRSASDEAVPMSASAGGASSDSAQGASQTSTTNNQVAGVDEADFIKNDNQTIYVANGSKFRIVQAWPPTEARELSVVSVPGKAKKLFVSGSRALVYSAKPRTSTGTSSGGNYYRGGYNSECTYGYQCDLRGDGTDTVISVFDVSNRSAPILLRQIDLDSSLLAARMVDGVVHTVLTKEFPHAAWQQSAGNANRTSETSVNAAYDQLLAANESVIANTHYAMPAIMDTGEGVGSSVLYKSAMTDGADFTTLVSIDLAANGSLKSTTILSGPGAVYASHDALYMAVPHESSYGGWYVPSGEEQISTVHKFALGNGTADSSYRGSGIVKGRVLNQFSMDENDGFLRIATTSGHVPDPKVYSTLAVLEDQAGKLATVGIVDQIAPTEDIRSVRFDGDRGYVVTFKKTDPLYVFDLGNPRAPNKLAELKIPGFSTYIHRMDATHLLTIGYDADDHGSFAYFNGVLLQIFDVSNPNDPQLTHKEMIGTRGSSSEALTNHLAFNYFAPKNLLAIPMTVCEGGGDGRYGYDMTFSGLLVYDVTADSGFSLHGKVSHPPAQSSTSNYYGNNLCSNWWTEASSTVERSIVMDDYVFSVSRTRIKVNALQNLSSDIREINIAE